MKGDAARARSVGGQNVCLPRCIHFKTSVFVRHNDVRVRRSDRRTISRKRDFIRDRQRRDGDCNIRHRMEGLPVDDTPLNERSAKKQGYHILSIGKRAVKD